MQDDQDKVTTIGTGGGIQRSNKLSAEGTHKKFGGRYVISNEDYNKMAETAEYFQDKCMQALGDNIWKTTFPQKDYIEKGWKSVLYTAPHDCAPDGRNILDYETALKKGLKGIINDVDTLIKANEITHIISSDKLLFWRSCKRVLEGTVKWVKNYATLAESMAQKETNEQRKKELFAIANICQRVPENPPQNFREAIQAWWMLYVAGHIEGSYLGYSPGRFDRYMYPYLKNDNSITADEVLELLELLRVKITEIEMVGSFAWEGLSSGNLFHNMILGGETRDGRAAENPLSYLVLQSAYNCRTVAPTLSIWYTNQTTQDFLLKAAEVVKTGVGFPAFFNFNVYLQHELNKNASKVSIEDIREYAAVGGCTEPVMEGMAYGIVQAGFINHTKVLELAMNGGVDPVTGIKYDSTELPKTLQELKDAYFFHLQKAISNWQRYWNHVMNAHKQVVNNYFAASLTKDCIKRGLSLDDGGAIINNTPTTLSSGMVNVANSFAGVEELLNKNMCDMATLRDALNKNWVGYENLHNAALKAPKWGNNDDTVDKHCVEIYDKYCKIVESQNNYLGEPYDPSMLAISTFVPFGKVTGATPDGRHKGEPLADGVTSPMPNTDKNGVFAVLKSSQKIDHTKIRGGLLNLKFHPITLKGVAGSEKLLNLIRTYFQKNAFQIQFNVVDSKILKDAQKHPENYRDLIVRVAGFSAIFVELSEAVQNEVIARTEQFLPYAGNTSLSTPTITFDNQDAYICDIQDFTLQDGPGIRTTVFFQGCPLSCKWCSNPETQNINPQYMINPNLCNRCGKCEQIGINVAKNGEFSFRLNKEAKLPSAKDEDICPQKAIIVSSKKMSAKELFERLKKNLDIYQTSNGGVTLSGGEPLVHYKFLHELMCLTKGYGIRLGIETCGKWKLNPIVSEILEGLDFIYYDLKIYSEEQHKKLTGVSNAQILSNLREIAEEHKNKIIISIPVIPGVNTNNDEVKKIAQYANTLGISKIRLLPYHGLGSGKYAKLGRQYSYKDGMSVDQEEIERLKNIVKCEGIREVSVE